MSIPNSLAKIAIFIPSSAIGGAEHYVKNILHLIQEVGFQPTLVVPENSQIVDFFSNLKVNYLISDIAWQGNAEDLKIGKSYLNKLSRQYREAIKILKFLNPDCAFINLPWVDFGLGISLACHDLQIPCTNLVHLCPWKVDLNELSKQLFQELAAANSSFFTVSHDNKIQLSLSTGIEPNLIKVFYNSRDVNNEYTSLNSRQYKLHRLDMLDELGLPLNSFVSISVGRFSHQKNFLDIITSFVSIHDKLPNYYHIFLGEGELKDYYQKIALDLGLSDRIKFLGYRKDVPRFLALSDLFISSSLYEGLALSILEAAQFLCPIIATNASSAKEIIPSSDYGLLYNPGQYHLLAKHIEYAFFNPQEMKNKAHKLNSFCQEKFSLEKFKKELAKNLKAALHFEKSQEHSTTSVFYDQEFSTFRLKSNFNIANYQYNGLPKNYSSPVYVSCQDYAQKILKESNYEFLHFLYKVSRKFYNSKIILCFDGFETNFFRQYYLKDQYLLLVIEKEQPNYITLNFSGISHIYWGQDMEPDSIAKFIVFEQIQNESDLKIIYSNKLKRNHSCTHIDLLSSYVDFCDSANFQGNFNIYFKIVNIIDRVFRPVEYNILESDTGFSKNKELLNKIIGNKLQFIH